MSTCFFISQITLPPNNEIESLKKRLGASIERLFNEGCETFITSITFFGFHLLAAKEIIKLKEKGWPVKMKIVHPFINYGCGNTISNNTKNILSAADEIIYLKKRCDFSYYLDLTDEVFFKESSHAIVYATSFEPYIMIMTQRAERLNIKLTVL